MAVMESKRLRSTDGRRVMLADLAREAGVCVSTASRAMRDLRGVNDRTRETVQRVARRLNYVPNASARSLVLGRSDVIALVTPPLDAETPPDRAAVHVEALVRAEGKRLIHITHDDTGCESLVRTALEQQWTAMVMIPYVQPHVVTEMAQLLRASGVHVVTVLNVAPGVDGVGYDRAHGIRLLLDHARSAGVRSVALVGVEPTPGALLRHDAKFRTIETDLRARDMTPSGCISLPLGQPRGPGLYQLAYERTARAWADGLRAEYFLGANDTIAVGVLHALIDAGVRVPGDAIVSGYDNHECSVYARPPLTTVERPVDDAVELAWSLLRRRISGETGEARSVMLQPRLIVRESTHRTAQPPAQTSLP